MLAMGETSGLSIAAMKRANETAGGRQLDAGLDRLWHGDGRRIDRGLATDGILPGGLKGPPPRPGDPREALLAERGNNLAQPHTVNDWLSVYAMAVNERTPPAARSSPRRPTAPPGSCPPSSATTATTASARPTPASAISC